MTFADSPHVGREDELAALVACLAAAGEGRPQVLFVEGDPGMGKSALIDAFLSAHPEVNIIGRVRCDRFEQNLAFGVAGFLLDSWLTETSVVQVGRQLLSWLNDRQAPGETAVLVIDDAQWLDRPSAQAIRLALRRLRVDTVLTVVARRPPGSADPWQDFSGHGSPATQLRLSPLDAPAVQELAIASRSWSLPVSAAEDLVRRTGGLPLLAQAVLADAASANGVLGK